uniref:Ribonuclease H-like domain-containing protein n=1 Tax=Tanacetum cinerariifolium TaxID=118510 RepID=A0A6L2KQM9_TANCI|nr:ribonuclease H-like domain-containing protein [Tanacetum cinerariifolium]
MKLVGLGYSGRTEDDFVNGLAKWKMRIEQYFLMTDYSLWEVILNGDSLAPTRVIDGVLQPVAPTTVEHKLARKNELKARGTLLMALPDKSELKFNTHKEAMTLMAAIDKRFGGNTKTKKKLISQFEILRVSFLQEDINLKFLRSLPSEWRTHTLMWRNKTDLKEQSLDDLFNSLKIYEAGVKSSSSAGTTTQNIAFVSSSNTDSANEPLSVAASVSAVSAKIPVSSLPNVDTLSNAVIYSFFASQSNSPQLDNDDLKQIDADDLEEIDLKWQMAMKGHFARECRSSKDTRMNGAAEPQRRNVPPTNYALIAFSSSSSSSDNEVVSCSKACTKAYAQLQSHYDKLTANYRKSQFDVISYQTGLESVEARLLVYQQNEYVFEEDIKLLKLEVQLRDNALVTLRQNIKKAEQERDDLKLRLEKFQTSSNNLTELLASQTNAKTGNGYHVVPPPYTGAFMPPKLDLAFHHAPNNVETDHPAFTEPDQDFSPTHRPSTPIIKDESETKTPQNVPSFVQPTKQVKPPRPSVQHVETSIPTATPKPAIPKPTSQGKRKNRKACFVCKSLDHLIKDCDYHEKKMAQTTARTNAKRGNHKHYAQMPLTNPQRHVVPTAVVTQVHFVRPVTTAAPKTKVTRPRHAKIVVTNPHSPPRRLINHSPSPKASNFLPKVTAAKAPMVNAAQGGQGKWVWKPKCPILDHVSRTSSASMTLKRFDYNDALGRSKCSRHMTGNMSHFYDFEELNGGYVAFGRNPKGGKISGKGKIRTGKLDFDDVNFVKELKFNLFSVSQMCDKKNSVLFNDTECLVLSPEFKLPDESQVLLRVHRENNMYNAEAVNNACYVQNRVFVTKPHNKTPYDLLHGRKPSIGFMRPFGCHVTILNTLDSLEKINGKVDEGFLFGYSVSSKDFKVFNSRPRIIQETLHVNFLENKPNVAGSGPTWLFDIDTLTRTMNYQPITVGNQSIPNAGVQEQFDAEKAGEEIVQQYMLFPVWSSGSTNPLNTDGDAAFDEKEPDFEAKKPESEVNVS